MSATSFGQGLPMGQEAGACTILLATYNRPAFLRQQLAYLGKGPRPGPILVLDSSTDSHAQANASAVAAESHVDYVRYPSEVPVFEKFSRGLQRVTTPYCMFLPDDDFVWLDSLQALIAVLDRDPASVAAHGLYCEFHTQGGSVEVTELIQGGEEHAAPRPTERLISLMRRYEALTYALYRTAAARDAFAMAARQESILAQELLAGTAVAVQGPVRRLPIVTHGRRAGSSLGYRRWHPLEWTAVDPADLFSAYLPYRQALLTQLQTAEPGTGVADLSRCIDLAHLAYLAPYLDADVLAAVARLGRQAVGETAIAETAWDVWAGARGPAWARTLRRGGRLTRWFRRQVRARGLRHAVTAWRARLRGGHAIRVDGCAGRPVVRFHERLVAQIEELSGPGSFTEYRDALAAALALRETTPDQRSTDVTR